VALLVAVGAGVSVTVGVNGGAVGDGTAAGVELGVAVVNAGVVVRARGVAVGAPTVGGVPGAWPLWRKLATVNALSFRTR
jgi:hypothetical protein